jgi:hypothetical protein
VVEAVTSTGAEAVIPLRSQRKTKHFRRVATRYDKLDVAYLAFALFAGIYLRLKCRQSLGSVGFTLIFLPPYSPDLNPIEKFWANMKRWIKNKITQSDTVYDTLALFFKLKTSHYFTIKIYPMSNTHK